MASSAPKLALPGPARKSMQEEFKSPWLSCFETVKHSWRGKYRRIFAVSDKCFATLNPGSFEETNKWEHFEEFVSIFPSSKVVNEFVITTRKKGTKKNESTTFSTEFRAQLLTDAQLQRDKFHFSPAQKPDHPMMSAYKLHWSTKRVSVTLSPQPFGLVQYSLDGVLLARYLYKDIEAICKVSDYPNAFVIFCGGHARLHLFALEQCDDLLKKLTDNAMTFIGINLKVKNKTITTQQFLDNRLGKFSNDNAVTSVAEFNVSKLSPRHTDPVLRLLCLTESCLVERDPSTYSVVTARPLEDVYSVVRCPEDPQRFSVEYRTGDVRTYLSTDRDALLASLLDSVRATGNRNVCIQMTPTDRGERYQPLDICADEEVESSLLKYISGPSAEMSFQLAVRRFNANVAYSGLVHAVTADGWFKENKEKLIHAALISLLEQGVETDSAHHLAGEFLAIRRLVASKAGFHAFTQVQGFKEQIGNKVIKALKRGDDGVTHAAMDMLCTLMQPMHDNYDLAQEQLNKQSLLQSKVFISKLLELLKKNADRRMGSLVVNSMLDFFTFAVCAPYSETTEGAQFDSVLAQVADLGRSLFRLFEHPSMAIVKSTGLIMKTIIEEGDDAMRERMQQLSLAEGALPRHLHTSLFTKSSDNRMLTHRQLSRHLIMLWCQNNKPARDMLDRIMPAGLLTYLQSEDEVPEQEQDRLHVRDTMAVAMDADRKNKRGKLDQLLLHWRSRSRQKMEQDTKRPVTLRRRRQNVPITNNWELFFYEFDSDHARADLIWNFKTREELREALENEMRAFMADRDLRSNIVISWNHTEFEVRYETLAEEIKIGDHYLRLLLEDDPKTTRILNPAEFFNDLYHRFLLTTKSSMKAMCLQAMSVVYGRCSDVIGPFNDTEYIVTMLNRCEDRGERDRLLQFMNVLLLNQKNVKRFIDAQGMRCLVDLVTLAHLHQNRATVPLQSNVIEASASQKMEQDEAEWYYNMGTDAKTKEGPIGFKKLKEIYAEGKINKETRMWAQGMEGWRPLKQIAQLKWTVVAEGTPIMDESELASLCLNMLIRICEFYPSRDVDGAIVRPLPRCKRILCEATCLPHIVQLLLTFDPSLVEKVATLLSNIMLDNANMPRLYLTGVYYFIMMYTGSNILPIAKFLKETHLFQAYVSDQATGRSILGPMIPQAMVCYLENYGPEKFASIFLGEFDTPEAIWGSEMRRAMIEKIALHIADFTPRLMSNSRALYQYCPIARIVYPQLEKELFCNIYYLRHFCDEQRFPDWPVTNHIDLLKDILEAWKVEVEKKASSMSSEEAFELLGLEKGVPYDTAKVRKAYFKMSMKYHPDKNPEGKDMFTKINKAYEHIISKEGRSSDGPNPENLVLILKAQSILFKRFSSILQPYKYAGYPMLVLTIKRESEDENLFSSSYDLLSHACELADHTVRCSNLNAEELRREGGLEILAHAFGRCVSVIGKTTTEDVMAVKVCVFVLRCFAAAAQFTESRERFLEIPQTMKDICRCLYFQGAPSLTMAAIECVAAFSVDEYLQNHLLHSGALWHLLLYLFGYDFTLDEGGVERHEQSNKQEFANKNAKAACKALARLAGYCRPDAPPEARTPPNQTIQGAVNALLTPYLANMLCDESNHTVLKLINSNSETPYLLWDNGTRGELKDFVEKQQDMVIRTGEQDPAFGAEFVFSVHRDELVIAGVFVRIYNLQPAFPLSNPENVCAKMLDFIANESMYLASAAAIQSNAPVGNTSDIPADQLAIKRQLRITKLGQALEGLRNVVKANHGVELICNGHYKLLFSLLQFDNPKVQGLTLEAIGSVVGNQECVNNIASSNVLAYLLMALESLPGMRQVALETFHALSSSQKIIVEALNNGGLVFLLDLYCNAQNAAVRQGAAALMAKMISDKLHGPRIRIIISKFLPSIFTDAMRENAEASVSMFESGHENPELIWNDESRQKVSNVVRELKTELYQSLKENPLATWKLPDDFAVVYEDIAGEVVVGGVFLRLLIKQPNWSFRRPKEFLVALMEKYVNLLMKKTFDSDQLKNLKVVTEALSCFLRAQPDMGNHVPSLGHLNKIIGAMNRTEQDVLNSCLIILNDLMTSQACVSAIGALPLVQPMMTAIRGCGPVALPASCEALSKIFEPCPSALIAQSLEHKFIEFLLELLRSGLDHAEGSAAAKAHLVKALKAMARDLTNGEQVTAVLDKCPWWGTWKEQRHDLFITGGPSIAGYLTGPTSTAAVAGYLMAPAVNNSAASSAPPPMEDDEKSAVKGSRRAAVGDPDA